MRRCQRCMKPLEQDAARCAHCGYVQNNADQPANALKKDTILNGRYLVGNVIGQGGFGITYVGFDQTLELKVAVKEYYPSGLASRTNTLSNEIRWDYSHSEETKEQEAGIARFLREAKRMARLDAVPAVVRARDAFAENGTAYIVMDYVEGETLKDHLMEHGVMQARECVKLLSPVMDSLGSIHEEGFIHRDISPDNIMIRPNGKAVLLDMGAVVDLNLGSGPSMIVVKKHFSAPEQQTENGTLGAWTDVYAMGATMYYCLTGKTAPEAMARIYNGEQLQFPAQLQIPIQVQNTICDAMQMDISRRIPDMGTLKERLQQALQGQDAYQTSQGQDMYQTSQRQNGYQTSQGQNADLFCRQCGARLTLGAVFCVGCGGRVTPDTQQSGWVTPPPSAPKQTSAIEQWWPVICGAVGLLVSFVWGLLGMILAVTGMIVCFSQKDATTTCRVLTTAMGILTILFYIIDCMA